MSTSCVFCTDSGIIPCGDGGDSSCEKRFCSIEHESLHKLPSNGTCMPIDILQDQNKGRYVVASRDIEAGELLFVDKPIVVGPNHEVPPLCITCSKEIDVTNICSSCGYPLCDLEKCSLIHGSNKECQILSLTKNEVTEFICGEINYQNWFAVLPLRLCILKHTKPKDYALIERLMDHYDKAIHTDRWKDIENHVLKRLEGQFSREEILKAAGVLDVNAYEIHSNIRGLFPISSLLSHGCITNIEHLHCNTKPYYNTCRASTRILKGEEIFANYICLFSPYLDRQKRLKSEWYFDCSCSRCVSGQNDCLDQIKCPSCYAYGIPQNDKPNEWKCLNCSNIFGGEEIMNKIKAFKNELDDIINHERYNIQRYLQVYNDLKHVLHPKHEQCIRLYRWLIPIYCREDIRGLYTLADLELKKEMIEYLLETINVCSPGINRTRGKILFEKVDVDYKLLNADCQRGSIHDIISISEKIRGFLKLCEEVKMTLEMGELSNYEKNIQKLNEEKILYFINILKTL